MRTAAAHLLAAAWRGMGVRPDARVGGDYCCMQPLYEECSQLIGRGLGAYCRYVRDCEFTVLNRALTVLENSPRADAPAAMVRMLRRCFNGLPRSLNLHQYYSELKVPQDSHGLLAGPLHLACFLACIQTLGSECTTSKEGVKAVIAAGLDQAVWDMFEYQLPPSVLEEGCLLLGDMTLRGMLYVPPSDQFVKFLAIPQMMIQGHLRRVCEMRVAGLLAPLKVMHSITAKTSLHCVLGTSTFPKTWDLLTEYQGSTTWSKWRWLLF